MSADQSLLPSNLSGCWDAMVAVWLRGVGLTLGFTPDLVAIKWLGCVTIRRLTYLVSPVPYGTLVDDSSPAGMIAGSSRFVAPVYAHHLQIFFQCVLPCPLWSSNVPLAIFRQVIQNHLSINQHQNRLSFPFFRCR